MGCHSEAKYTDKDEEGETEISGTLTIFTSNEELAAYLKDQYSKSVFSDYSYALTARTAGNTGPEALDGAGSTRKNHPMTARPQMAQAIIPAQTSRRQASMNRML